MANSSAWHFRMMLYAEALSGLLCLYYIRVVALLSQVYKNHLTSNDSSSKNVKKES